jgi:hypothetical protein
MRISPADVDALRAAGFPPDEAAEHGFYHKAWEGWAVVAAVAFALCLPIAALILG